MRTASCAMESWPVDDLTPEEQARLVEVLEGYMKDLDEGREPDMDRIAAEHPELAEPLAACLDSVNFLHRAALALECSETEEEPPRDIVERRIGDYRIVREIGRGGMGVVYEAQQTSLNRRVALKVLPFAAVLDQRQIARFENEARSAAQLHHPHIVPVFAVGCERGVHYYAMQYVEGQPFDMAIQEMRRPGAPTRAIGESDRTSPGELKVGSDNSTLRSLANTDSAGSRDYFRAISQLGIQAADALQHAHDYGIVHRDVKPSNLLLDREAKLWIADFGLARCQTDAGMTTTGQVIGTLNYMSPEQAAGKTGLMDHRTDIYSLGITLYEALTLCPAFEGTDRAELLKRIGEEEPKLPRRINPAIPWDLETIVLKAISKLPSQRYTSAGEMAKDLHRFLDGKPTLARRPTLAQRAAKWAGRHRRAVFSAVALVAVAMAGLLTSTLLISQAHSRTSAALEQSETNLLRAETHYREAREVVDLFGARLAQQLADVPGADQLRYELLNRTLDYYQGFVDHAGDDPSLQSDLAFTHFKAAAIAEQMGDSEHAAAAYNDARKVFAQLVTDQPHEPAYRGDLALCHNNLGLLAGGAGDTVAAAAAYGRAIEIQEDLALEFPEQARFQAELALSYGNLGLLAQQTDRVAEAERAYRRAIAIEEDLAAKYSNKPKYQSDLAISYSNLSSLHAKTDPTEAVDYCRRAIEIFAELSDSHPHVLRYQSDLALAHNNLGTLQNHCGQMGQSAASFARAVELQRQLVRKAPAQISYRRDLAVTYNNLGRLHGEADETTAAEESLANARAIFEDLVCDYPNELSYRSSLGGVLNNQAMALERLDRPEEAERAYRKAVEHQRIALERAGRVVRYREFLSKHYWNYGQFLLKQGRTSEAGRVALARKKLWENNPDRLYGVAVELAAIIGAADESNETAGEGPDDESLADWAVTTLQEAIANGLDRLDRLQEDPDLDKIRDHPRFRELLDVLADRCGMDDLQKAT